MERTRTTVSSWTTDTPILPVIVLDKDPTEPAWISAHYIPSTWPAAKAPHGFLSDGRQAFFDLFGMKYTFVEFPEDGQMAARIFAAKAKRLVTPLKSVYLPNESHCRHLG
jgi:hypothetical protein